MMVRLPRILPLVALSALVLIPAFAARPPADLEAIKAEPKLERRARYALKFAKTCVKRVLKAYQDGDTARGEELLLEIQEAVELAYDSLMATGKHPRKKPKHFKRAEIRTRRLLSDLDELRRNLHYDERKTLDAVQAKISEINDKLLMAIMTKPKK